MTRTTISRSLFRRVATLQLLTAILFTQSGAFALEPIVLPLRIQGGGALEQGASATLSVSGGFGPETYQWHKDGVAIPDATSPQYSIAAATPSDAGTYSINSIAPPFSSLATTQVTVKPPAAPAITQSPYPTTVNVGQSPTFGYNATGSYPRTHQWRKNGVDIPGATESSYTLSAATMADAGNYSVVVTNSLGSATSTAASLTVQPAVLPVLSKNHPQNKFVTQFSSLSLAAIVNEGSPPYTYQWLKNGAPVTGATSETLTLDSAALSDAGKYSVIITNAAGSATSREATLTVNPAIPVSITSPLESQVHFEGQSASFSVYPSGSPPFTYQWLKNGSPIPNRTSGSLYFHTLSLADAGNYSVVVGNVLGQITTAPATLTVNPAVPPTITIQPTSLAVADGEWALIQMTATGSAPLRYQWYRNGVAIDGATGSGIYFQEVRSIQGGTYSVTVTNAGGTAISREIDFTVLPPLAPNVAELSSVTALLGANARLEIPWWDVPPDTTFQWFKDGVPVPRARQSMLDIFDVQSSDVGDYFVVATNATGSTPSFAARLTALAPPDSSDWVAAERMADIVYFARTNPGRIERFDLSTDAWLPAIPLGRDPLAMVATNDALYVSFGSTLARFTLDGSSETAFSTAFASDVVDLELSNDTIIAHELLDIDESRLTLVRLSDGVKSPARLSRWYSWGEITSIPTSNRILTLTAHSSPVVGYVSEVKADGSISEASRGPYHGDFPPAKRLLVYPDETFFADDAGIVYDTTDLTFAGSLGGDFDDLAFTRAGEPLALRGGVIHVYKKFIEQGRLDTGFAGARMFVHGGDAFVFGSSGVGGTIARARVSLADARSLPSAAPINAHGLSFTPDDLFVDRNGVLFLFSKSHRQLFRWSITERRFLTPIPLQGWANHVAYSATTHRIYVAYADSRVTQLKLDAGSIVEEPFFTSIRRIDTLTTAGEFVLLHDGNTSNSVRWRFVLTPDGVVTTFDGNTEPSRNYEWAPALRRLYHFRDWVSPNDLLHTTLSTSGAAGVTKNSPYHGDLELVPRYPIRLSPDNRTVLIGTGRFYDAETLSLIADYALANRVDDAVWLENRLYTVRALDAGIEVQRWSSANYALDRAVTLPGYSARLFPAPNGQLLLVATQPNHAPTFTFLSADLVDSTLPRSPVTFTTQPVSQSASIAGSVTLSVAQTGAAGSITYSWQKNGATVAGANAPNYTITDLRPSDAGIYSAIVTDDHGKVSSAPAIVAPKSDAKILGDGVEVDDDIVHPNGNVYDQFLLQGGAVSVTADTGQVLRISYIDLTDDIVQIEFTGAGTLSLSIDYPSSPAPAVNYVQPDVHYVRGHANIVIVDADETSHLSVFTVGRANAINQSLFRPDAIYDGVADLASIAIHSRDGKFGGVRAANASFFAIRGITGLYAPGVAFTGPVYIGDINAIDVAKPFLALGSTPELRITGGNLAQTNGAPVHIDERVHCVFADGTTSHGSLLPAQPNHARFEQDGVDVTDSIISP